MAGADLLVTSEGGKLVTFVYDPAGEGCDPSGLSMSLALAPAGAAPLNENVSELLVIS